MAQHSRHLTLRPGAYVILGVSLLISLTAISMFVWPIQSRDAILLVGAAAAYATLVIVQVRSEARVERIRRTMQQTTRDSVDSLQSGLVGVLHALGQRTIDDHRHLVKSVRTDQQALKREFDEVKDSLAELSTTSTSQMADVREYLSGIIEGLSNFEAVLSANSEATSGHYITLQKTSSEHASAILSAAETHNSTLERISESVGEIDAAVSGGSTELKQLIEHLSRQTETKERTLSAVHQELTERDIALQELMNDTKTSLNRVFSEVGENLAEEIARSTAEAKSLERAVASQYSEQSSELREYVGRALATIDVESRETRARLAALSIDALNRWTGEQAAMLTEIGTRARQDKEAADRQYEDIKNRQLRVHEEMKSIVLSACERQDRSLKNLNVILQRVNLLNSKESWQSIVLRQSLSVPEVSKTFELADIEANEESVQAVNAITDHVEQHMNGRYAGTRRTRQAHLLPVVTAAQAMPDEPEYAHVEIGTLFGGSLVSRLKLLEQIGKSNQTVIAIDPLESYYSQTTDPVSGLPVDDATVRANLEKFECPQDHLLLVKELSTSQNSVDAVSQFKVLTLFIDGDHSYEVVRSDWETYSPFVVSGGYVILDDYGSFSWPGVIRFVNEAIENQMLDGWRVLGLFGDAVIIQKQ